MSSRTLLALTIASAAALQAQPLRSLKQVAVPRPDLSQYVQDPQLLVVLGKAFFWDMQAGSDGRTACASCHFHAGADHRSRNQILDPNGQAAPNRELAMADFPFRLLSNPLIRNSNVLRDTPAVAGSAGLIQRTFLAVTPGDAAEAGAERPDDTRFVAAGLQLRRVTARNSPSVINAVFNVRNFWDGRAQRVFNGFSPNGDGPGALVLGEDGEVHREPVSIDRASLASQATGPILDHLEMSYAGRTWGDVGRKILALQPLALQNVSPTDSVLGPYARPAGSGLQHHVTYRWLIENSFRPEYWAAGGPVENGFTQVELNFPLFWGLALQAYQQTLVSDDTPFDRFMDGDSSALGALEIDGRNFFQTGNQGRCTTCHGGAEFTAASFTSAGGGRGGNANRAFQRTGVRPPGEDAGSGNGNFRSIGLRNVELTGPYFHNGGQATLDQVVEFYARAGDFGNNALRTFNLTEPRKASLVAFLKALTDERVRFDRAPFDHPELCVPAGHLEAVPGRPLPAGDEQFPMAAKGVWVELRAVGAEGHDAPLQTFEELLQGVGRDGSRSHTMSQPCRIDLR